MGIKKKIQRRLFGATVLVVLLFTIICASVSAVEEQPRVLKVAFPQVKGMTETAADGTRYGLVVDYLNEISKYTGWEYEYIDTTGETMIDEFVAGKYDLMGGNYYSSDLEDYFAYPEYNTGYSKSVLFALRDDQRMQSYNLESLNGKTIGVYINATEKIQRLNTFLAINGLNCKLKYYNYEQLSKNGNLYEYLKNGDVDLLLGNDAENDDFMRAIASFDAQPHYIVTTVGNQEVLDGLNMALEKILDSNPNFAEERFEANFPDKITAEIHLNEEEQTYIQEKKHVTVVMPQNWHPLSCESSGDDPHSGIIPDIFGEIAAFTGLKIDYVYTETYMDAVHMVQRKEADILGFYLGSENDSIQQELALTSPYISMNSILVRNKMSSYPAENLVGAVVEGRKLPSGIAAAVVRSYSDVEDALAAVDKGEIDFIYGMAPRLEREIQRNHYQNLVPVTLVNDRSEFSFALSRPVESELLTILNKAIYHISDEEKSEILDRNMISLGTNDFSFKSFIYANPVMFIFILSIILLIIVTIVLWVNRTRVRAAVMQSELKNAEAENRAKGEFLSRMSHEIRTPMNAIVGLSELTTMEEEVPDKVRESLSKILSSSHYLLDLINDTLDMSRIESGMLSIVQEPFSLEHMLNDVQGMMEGEAQRRNIHYTLEKKIVHSGLMGDVIRLRQVLTNLLSNAFKFTGAGGKVVLQIEETDSTEDTATIDFRVINDGIGISSEDQARIFDAFEQVGPNPSKSQGTGLGLPISRNIVQMMGGDLCVNSEPEKGSTFYFTVTFPLGEPIEAVPEQEVHSASTALLKDVQVLLAEDNDLNAEIAASLLEIQGAAVCRVGNGKQAVERFQKSKPNEFQVILMDIQMPEMNGLEASCAIRDLPRTDARTIPIIAMTANSFKEDVDAAMAAGMNGFVAKPLDVNYLYSLLRRLLKEAEERK